MMEVLAHGLAPMQSDNAFMSVFLPDEGCQRTFIRFFVSVGQSDRKRPVFPAGV
jgi:hypothetical protein